MRNTMFAFACAASAAAFALGQETTPAYSGGQLIGFEGYTFPEGQSGFTGIFNKTDIGSDNGDKYWFAEGASTDGSTVKAYGTNEGEKQPWESGASASGEAGRNYLELNTEGATLWRTMNYGNGTEMPTSGVDVPDGGIYIDTMVQFTPTEGADVPLKPTSGEGDNAVYSDKLAIWLASSSDSAETNLMVFAKSFDFQSESTTTKFETYKLAYVDGDAAINVNPGEWHRLTVKGRNIPDATGDEATVEISVFTIYLDGKMLKAVPDTEQQAPFTSEFLEGYGEDDSLKTELASNTMIAGLGETKNKGTAFSLTAVGFQGTGAIDALNITAENPFGGTPAATEYVLSITLGTGVGTVTYTIDNNSTTISTSTGTDNGIKVAAGKMVSFTATADGWYTIGEIAGVTMDGNKTVEVTATAVVPSGEGATISSETKGSDVGITDGAFKDMAGDDLAKAVTWAKAQNKSPDDLSSMTFAAAEGLTASEKAYLLNCAENSVNTEEQAFSVSIKFNENGEAVVDAPEGKTYNGEFVLQYKNALTGEWSDEKPQNAAGQLFYRGVLRLPATPAQQ